MSLIKKNKLGFLVLTIFAVGFLFFAPPAHGEHPPAGFTIEHEPNLTGSYLFWDAEGAELELYGSYDAGATQYICPVDGPYDESHAYQLSGPIYYRILGTGIEGEAQYGQEAGNGGECASYNNYIYTFVKIIDVSSLTPGVQYTIRVNASNDRSPTGQESITDVWFTRPAPESGTIEVSSNQNTCWSISGPDNPAGCGLSRTYSEMPLGTYSLTADDLTNYTKTITYDPSDRNLTNGGVLRINITYNPTGGGGNCEDPAANNFGGALPCTYDPPGCDYSIAPTSQNFGYGGGTGTISVTTTSGCSWVANSNNSFITITGGSSGTGSGTISYSVSANGSTSSRNGSINAAGNNFSISQDGAPGAACSDDSGLTVVKGLKASYTPGETDTFTIRVSNAGSSSWYSSSAYQFVQLTNMSISPTYGQISPSVPSGNTSDYREFTFNFTAPSTTGSYNLRMQMVHRAAWNYQRNDGSQCLAAPGSDTYFGNQYNASFNVQPSTGPQIVFTLVYSPIPPNTPYNVTVDNSLCSKITVNWSFNSNGVEDGFRVYRSTDGTSWADISGVLPVSARSYQDTPPQFNVRYYYMVRAKKSVAGNAESQNSNVANALNVACVANLNPSSMALTRVNGVNYTSSTQIKNGDILTYEIVIRNVGTDDAGIQRICVNPGSNLSNATNLSVTGPGSVNGGISTNNAQCISDGNSGLRFNVTGNKDRTNHWYITYNTTFTSTAPASTQETITNSAVIYFTDDEGAHQKTVTAGTVIIDTSKPKVPTFREVAP